MTTPLPEYGDAEALVVVEGAAALDLRLVTDLPAELLAADVLPLVQVGAFGGVDLDPARELVRLDADVYVGPDADGEPDRAGARDIAERVRAWFLRGLPGTTRDGMTVQRVRTISRPTARPYDESPVRRCHAAYELVIATRR